jgi:hypothetical protein
VQVLSGGHNDMGCEASTEEGVSDVLASFTAVFSVQEPPLPTFALRCAHFSGVAGGLRDHHLVQALGMELLDDAAAGAAGAAALRATQTKQSDTRCESDRAKAYNTLLLALCRGGATDRGYERGRDGNQGGGAGAGFTTVPLHEPAEAVKRAHELVLEMVGASVTIRSESWAALLNATCSHGDDDSVESVLRMVETSLKQLHAPASLPQDSSTWSYPLALARLRAYARARRGYECLEILQEIRRYAGKYEHLRGDRRTQSASERSAGTQARGRVLYHQVIEALYRAIPRTDRHWQLIMAPDASVDFILREMARDGVQATPSTIAALLTLYTKAAHISCRNRSSRVTGAATTSRPENDRSKAVRLIEEAELLLQKVSAVGGHFGHPRMRVNSKHAREIVRACVICGLEEKAMHVLSAADPWLPGRLDASTWEPLVYYYAAVHGAEVAAEDVVTLMLNEGLVPTQRIADAFITGLLRPPTAPERASTFAEEWTEQVGVENENDTTADTDAGDGRQSEEFYFDNSANGAHSIAEAIDKAQEMYNQHSVRASLPVLLRLREHAALSDDVYELPRAEGVILNLYPEVLPEDLPALREQGEEAGAMSEHVS